MTPGGFALSPQTMCVCWEKPSSGLSVWGVKTGKNPVKAPSSTTQAYARKYALSVASRNPQ